MTDGMKSSEAIITLVVMALIFLAKWLGVELDPAELAALAGSGAGYAVSRGIAKTGSKAPVKGKYALLLHGDLPLSPKHPPLGLSPEPGASQLEAYTMKAAIYGRPTRRQMAPCLHGGVLVSHGVAGRILHHHARSG